MNIVSIHVCYITLHSCVTFMRNVFLKKHGNLSTRQLGHDRVREPVLIRCGSAFKQTAEDRRNLVGLSFRYHHDK